MEYIAGIEGTEGCIFCDLPASGDDDQALIVARGGFAYVILNRFPYTVGHLMVAPFRHTADYTTLTPEEHAEIGMWTSRALKALDELYKPQGFNLGMNLGRAGGAGVAGHLHGHVVPRWSGDSNFMTTVGDTKVLPESLEQTLARLKPLLA